MAFPALAALFGGMGAAGGGAAGGAGWMEIIKQLGGGLMAGGGGAPQGGAPLMSAQGPPPGQWNPNVNLGGGPTPTGSPPMMSAQGGGGGGGGTPGAKMTRRAFNNIVDSSNMVFSGLNQFGTSLAGSDKRGLNNIHRNTPPVITPEMVQNPSGLALNALMAKIAGLG